MFSNQIYMYRLSGNSPKVLNAKTKKFKKQKTKKVQKKKKRKKGKKKETLLLGLRLFLLLYSQESVITHGNSVRYHRNGISNLQIV